MKIIRVLFLLLIMQAGLSSCSSSDDNPPLDEEIELLPGSSVRLVFDNPDVLRGIKDPIEQTIREMVPAINELLPINNLLIRVIANPSMVIPEIGVGGFNPNSSEVLLWIDSEFPGIANSINTELGPQLSHELHHAMRRRSVGYGSTLGQAIISEGLADHFSIEVSGIDPPLWSKALSDSELSNWISIASDSWTDDNYNHGAWFVGTSKDIPRWTGYSIGYRLVEDYLNANPTAKPSALVSEPAASFAP